MGNTDTKLNFRKAVVQLTTKTQVCLIRDDVITDTYQLNPLKLYARIVFKALTYVCMFVCVGGSH